jgi:hypothetical protein
MKIVADEGIEMPIVVRLRAEPRKPGTFAYAAESGATRCALTH